MKRLLIAAVAVAALSAPGLAQAAPTVFHTNATSSNWAGYIASGAGQTFTDVEGTWTQPSVTCAARATTYSSFWVGLGGSTRTANGLEQIGTEADCRNGTPSYSAWYELIPAPSVDVPLTISPGDSLTGEVTVAGTQVTLSLTDTTTGGTYSKTVTLAKPDLSSAEWIAEAPSYCAGAGTNSCRLQQLSNFGSLSFSGATATANGVTGVISDASWTNAPTDLHSTTGGASATTGALGADGASFTVTVVAAPETTTPSPGPGSQPSPKSRPAPPRVAWRWRHPAHRR